MEKTTDYHIISAQTPEHLTTAKTLFTKYAEWLDIDLTFQDFESELNDLPGKYGAPHGELLLAFNRIDGSALGCVAVRPLQDHSSSSPERGANDYCEMKRLYVSPEARGMGLGKALVDAIARKAKDLGYREMRLDSLPLMQGAIRLYRRMGFVEIQPYYVTPVEGTHFLALDLTREAILWLFVS